MVNSKIKMEKDKRKTLELETFNVNCSNYKMSFMLSFLV